MLSPNATIRETPIARGGEMSVEGELTADDGAVVAAAGWSGRTAEGLVGPWEQPPARAPMIRTGHTIRQQDIRLS
jgi:hypothetical protein